MVPADHVFRRDGSNGSRALVLASRSGHYMAELVHRPTPFCPSKFTS